MREIFISPSEFSFIGFQERETLGNDVETWATEAVRNPNLLPGLAYEAHRTKTDKEIYDFFARIAVADKPKKLKVLRFLEAEEMEEAVATLLLIGYPETHVLSFLNRTLGIAEKAVREMGADFQLDDVTIKGIEVHSKDIINSAKFRTESSKFLAKTSLGVGVFRQ